MSLNRALVLLVLLIGAACTALTSWAGQEPGQKKVVAVVNGVELTQADLEDKEAAKLLQPRDQYYVAQKQALDQLIDDTLLEMQAQREKLTVQELLDRHVNSQIKEPTEDQLQVYYEGLQTESSYPAMRDKIVETIHQHRFNKIKAEYIRSLRANANLQVLLFPPTAQVALGDSYVRGPKDAPVVIIEFADYECPYCRKFHPDMKKLEQEFPGKIAFAYKDFPLPMHKSAQKAAEAARCAGEQGRFWEYHDLLFETNSGLEPDHLKDYAHKLNLDSAKFDACLDSGEGSAAVKTDQEQGRELGITGTPSLFVNHHFYSGAINYASLREIVQQQLSSAAVVSPGKETAKK